MERIKKRNRKRGAFHPHQRPAYKELRNLLRKVQILMDKLGYGSRRARARHIRRLASAPADQGMSNVRTNFEENKVLVFTNYEEYQKRALRSFESISIVVKIDGTVVFISENVLPLLGHHPEDIVGKTLLNIIPDEQKEEISQKIILHLPLASTVGSLTKFCCYVRKGNAYQNVQQSDDDRGDYEEKEIYDYVKFMLHLQDSYDESFVFWGNYGPNSRNIQSSAPRLLGEQYYYLVGTVTVLRKQPESEHPTEIQSNVIVIDSDDDIPVKCRRLEKQHQYNELQRICQDEASNMEHPDSDLEVEIVDIQAATQQTPLGTVETRTSPPLSTSRNISATTSKSTGSGQESKDMLEPMDVELEVPPGTLLNDSQEEEGSPEQEGSRDEDEKKTLEEAKISNPNEQSIDEITVLSKSASDKDFRENFCEDIEDKKNDKTPEIVVNQAQGQQKAPETAPTIPISNKKRVYPQAVVKPMVHRDQTPSGVTEFQHPRLSERVAVLDTPQRRAEAYDLRINEYLHSTINEQERPLLGERFALLNTLRRRAQAYDLSITGCLHDTDTDERPLLGERFARLDTSRRSARAYDLSITGCLHETNTEEERPLLGERFARLDTSRRSARAYDLSITGCLHDTNAEEEPMRSFQFQRPLLGERFALLDTSRRAQAYDLSRTGSLHDTNTEEEDREQEHVYELDQSTEMLHNLCDPTQTGQGEENLEYLPQQQMVTATNDLESGPINLYGNDNSEHSQNQTNRLSEDPVDCTSPLLPHPSARSCQAMTVPHQPLTVPCCPLATAGCPPAASQYSSARPQDPPVQSDHTSSDYLRENRQQSQQPGQESSECFLTEENTINPHP